MTHTGGLLSYTFSEQFSVTAGVVLGWDNSRDNNNAVSYTGQFALTPIKDLTANLNWIVGPEQNDNKANQRAVLDLVVNYTGLKNTILSLNADYGFAEYRHDAASEKVFKARTSRPDASQGVSPQSKTLEKISLSL